MVGLTHVVSILCLVVVVVGLCGKLLQGDGVEAAKVWN